LGSLILLIVLVRLLYLPELVESGSFSPCSIFFSGVAGAANNFEMVRSVGNSARIHVRITPSVEVFQAYNTNLFPAFKTEQLTEE
jgi:hypothetical protein